MINTNDRFLIAYFPNLLSKLPLDFIANSHAFLLGTVNLFLYSSLPTINLSAIIILTLQE